MGTFGECVILLNTVFMGMGKYFKWKKAKKYTEYKNDEEVKKILEKRRNSSNTNNNSVNNTSM
jgi:hypothetical protein